MKLRLRRKSRQKGAVAVIVAVALIMCMAAAALAVDISVLVGKQSEIQAALDAAATAGVQKLPGEPAQAKSQAAVYADLNSPGLSTDPDINFEAELRCVVPITTSGVPNWTAAKWQCGITSHAYDPANCDSVLCVLPCPDTKACNTLVVTAQGDDNVDYYFGPAIGQPTGSTGRIVSAACKGSCGTVSPNPMNIVLMADRTASMSTDSINAMKDGMKDMLTVMSREQQYLAVGAIHKSVKRYDPYVTMAMCDTMAPQLGVSGFDKAKNAAKTNLIGTWVPTDFSNTYTTGSADLGTLAANEASPIWKAINCMMDYGTLNNRGRGPYKYPDDATSGLGTHLAAALKGAYRKLTYGSNIAALDAGLGREGLGEPKNVIILETDGRPEEIFNSPASYSAMDLTNTNDPGTTDGKQACRNLEDMANAIKRKDVLILTIGYGRINEDNYRCGGTGTDAGDGERVRDVIARVASKDANGNASTATNCVTGSSMAENSDGDNYYCAASKEELAAVFATAMGAINGRSKLMALPGITPGS